jgi:hypothetical protein
MEPAKMDPSAFVKRYYDIFDTNRSQLAPLYVRLFLSFPTAPSVVAIDIDTPDSGKCPCSPSRTANTLVRPVLWRSLS